jgi:hypothetical protein
MGRRRATYCGALFCGALLCAAEAGGCSFGPRALENTHGKYNEAVRQVTEEETLLNIVRLRYNDYPERLDVTSIASQYELQGAAEARPFFLSPNPSNSNVIFKTFTAILPDVSLTGAQRPTISLTPADDPETTRSLFTPSTPDGIIFLSETSYPISTVFRLNVEYLNRVPNAVTASGPPRPLVPEFQQFQRVVQLLQVLKDASQIRFLSEEKLTEVGGPLPAAAVTAAAQVEAARNGMEYRQRPDQSWVLVRRSKRLTLRVSPAAANGPEMHELCQLLNLKPGLLVYEITVGAPEEAFPLACPPEESATINLYPRSTVQAAFYMAHGVVVPPEHLQSGVATAAVEPDGTVFDWQQVTGGLFTVHSVRQHHRPACAAVAVKYRDYWFYIDDRDADSKITFELMMMMTRMNLLGVHKTGAPALTLPVGR